MFQLLYIFPILVLACWQIIEVWHHGTIFAKVRARLEASENMFAQLTMCPYCLSVWVGFFLAFGTFLSLHINSQMMALFYGFAISRAANFCNDRWHFYCRTPGSGLPDFNTDLVDEDEKEEPDASEHP